jgi:hypothetical protein
MVDTDGKPGLTWRARRANKDLHRGAALAAKEAKHAARAARRETKLQASELKSKSLTKVLPFG